jgi:hypothetical protein
MKFPNKNTHKSLVSDMEDLLALCEVAGAPLASVAVNGEDRLNAVGVNDVPPWRERGQRRISLTDSRFRNESTYLRIEEVEDLFGLLFVARSHVFFPVSTDGSQQVDDALPGSKRSGRTSCRQSSWTRGTEDSRAPRRWATGVCSGPGGSSPEAPWEGHY